MRGLNSDSRQRAVRNKINESMAIVVCVQETKMQHMDFQIVRRFCPKRFDQFAYIPSRGASGGFITLWNSSILTSTLVETQNFGLVVSFISNHTSEA